MDMMDTMELFNCCKIGDLGRVKYLIEVKEVEVNIRDTWDSTPLYYACLCGHKDLVRYLLECGAKCEAKTFDGERCLYGALTDEIREVLKSYKAVTTGHARTDMFQEFLRKLLESGLHADITFMIHNQSFPAHRCILHARSSYFAEMLETKWRSKQTIHIKSAMVRPEAFRSMLQYVYTGFLEVHIDVVEDCMRFAKQCNLTDLIEKLNARLKVIEKFVPQKPGTEITMVSIEPSQVDAQIQEDFETLADIAIPPELRRLLDIDNIPFYGEIQYAPPFADVCFSVKEHEFYCHKVFFIRRSDYFRALITDHFSESEMNSDSKPIITLHDIPAQVFSKIVYYIYTDRVEELDDVSSYDLLCIADLYLLPGLKKICANEIANHLTESNVINIIRVSRMFNLTKLEDQCAEFMANILDRLLESKEFAELVKEDAASIKDRQETDSIMIIDDIRYHIASTVQTFSAVDEAQEKLQALDHFLIGLGVEC